MQLIDYTIITSRLKLREWKEKDIEPFITINADKDVMQYFPKTQTADETLAMMGRIKKHFKEKGFGLFAVELKSTKEFIGFTGFSTPTFESFFTPCIEIGWRYAKHSWYKGYATEAANACIKYGFETLQLDKIFSFTAVLNVRSENVMKRISMQKLGEFDHPIIDAASPLCRHVVYKITRDEFRMRQQNAT